MIIVVMVLVAPGASGAALVVSDWALDIGTATRRRRMTAALNGARCQLERFTGGAAVGDADRDGQGDLYVPRRC